MVKREYFINDVCLPSKEKEVEYLTAIKTQCPYSNNTFTCDGKAKIKRYLVHTTNQWSEFIGCDKWKQNEKGKDPKSEDDMDCNKLYPSGYHQKYCDTKHNMLEILKAKSLEVIHQIFEKIQMCNED
ncbi:15783_t:CDS:2, partial [Funneliformis geosporum]